MKLTDCSLPSIWLWTAIVFDACTVPNPCSKIGTSRRSAIATVTGIGGACDATRGATSARRQRMMPAATITAMPAIQRNRRTDRPLAFSAITFMTAPVHLSETLYFLHRGTYFLHRGTHGKLAGRLKIVNPPIPSNLLFFSPVLAE